MQLGCELLPIKKAFVTNGLFFILLYSMTTCKKDTEHPKPIYKLPTELQCLPSEWELC